MKKKIIIAVIVVMVIAVFVIVNLKSQGREIEVQTEKVFRADITQTVTGNGKIYPVTEVKISARVPGKIVEIAVDEGDSVKAGQVLVRLEQEQYRAQLERARSALLGAQANLKLAKSNLDRTRELFEKNLASRSELEAAQAQYDQALSQVQQAEANVKEAEDALEKTVLSTPISGVVIQKNKEVGEIALGSQFQEDVILVVADLSEMEARVEVNENDIINVSEGDTASVEIDAFPDTAFTGIVTEIANTARTVGQGSIEEVTNFEVKIRLLNRLPSFRPGMSATADIATETHKNVLNVPIQSVTVRERKLLERKLSQEEKHARQDTEEEEMIKKKKGKKEDDLIEVVFVVKDNIAHMQPVKVGISDANYYEVLQGLNEGDEVVTGPFKVVSQTLKDGDRVKVKNKEEAVRRK